MVIEVYESLATGLGGAFATSTRLFAVPANKSRTVLMVDSPNDAVFIQSQSPREPGALESTWNADDYIEPHYDWVN